MGEREKEGIETERIKSMMALRLGAGVRGRSPRPDGRQCLKSKEVQCNHQGASPQQSYRGAVPASHGAWAEEVETEAMDENKRGSVLPSACEVLPGTHEVLPSFFTSRGTPRMWQVYRFTRESLGVAQPPLR